MVARPMSITRPRFAFRGPVLERFLKPLARGDWAQFSREVCLEGGTGTGKTLGLGVYLRNFLRMFPGCHWLVIRRYKADLPGSWMQTWEDEVLDPTDKWDQYMLEGPSRETRSSYEYPNGSTIWLRGMNQWPRVKSMAFDGIWAVEGTEITKEQAQGLQTRVRPRVGVRVPVRQLIYDVNPGAPGHWLNKRCDAGICERLKTTIRDNPGYWDATRNAPTEDGAPYIERMLASLDGHMYRRLWLCEWAAATGVILRNFEPSTHLFEGSVLTREHALDELIVVDHDNIPQVVQIGWYLASVDWGRRHAGTLQVWAVDLDGRQYLIEEYYHAERPIFWWGEIAVDVARRYGAGRGGCSLRAFVCDNAWPDNISYLNQILEQELGYHAAVATECKKATKGEDASNLEVLRSGYEVRADGRPMIYMSRNALQHAPDMSLPIQRLADEIPAWSYAPHDEERVNRRPRDEPDPACVDDGLDAATYARVYILGGRESVPTRKRWTEWNPRSAEAVAQKTGWKMHPGEN